MAMLNNQMVISEYSMIPKAATWNPGPKRDPGLRGPRGEFQGASFGRHITGGDLRPQDLQIRYPAW